MSFAKNIYALIFMHLVLVFTQPLKLVASHFYNLQNSYTNYSVNNLLPLVFALPLHPVKTDE